MYIMDLHNHTTFSYDGSDTPEAVIENAIAHGVAAVGITDHQFSIGTNLWAYYEKIETLKRVYAGRIRVLCGLEVGTRPKPDDLLPAQCAKLDFCLFESLDSPSGMDLYEFIEWRRLFTVPCGLAHTDIFALSARYGVDMLQLMRRERLFWELNTSGNYDYYYDFLTSREKQQRAAAAGIPMSVGSDTHAVCGYNAQKLRRAHALLQDLNIPLVSI